MCVLVGGAPEAYVRTVCVVLRNHLSAPARKCKLPLCKCRTIYLQSTKVDCRALGESFLQIIHWDVYKHYCNTREELFSSKVSAGCGIEAVASNSGPATAATRRTASSWGGESFLQITHWDVYKHYCNTREEFFSSKVSGCGIEATTSHPRPAAVAIRWTTSTWGGEPLQRSWWASDWTLLRLMNFHPYVWYVCININCCFSCKKIASLDACTELI